MRYYHFDELNPSVQDAAMLEFREKFNGKLVEMAGDISLELVKGDLAFYGFNPDYVNISHEVDENKAVAVMRMSGYFLKDSIDKTVEKYLSKEDQDLYARMVEEDIFGKIAFNGNDIKVKLKEKAREATNEDKKLYINFVKRLEERIIKITAAMVDMIKRDIDYAYNELVYEKSFISSMIKDKCIPLSKDGSIIESAVIDIGDFMNNK